ncbi:hypothetical protein Patl1_35334 [Pistacia atlantica]|nr:hypothetical protein Patl1_35334 [Pistacia atlantica]
MHFPHLLGRVGLWLIVIENLGTILVHWGPLGKPQSIVVGEESVSKAQEQQSATELLSLGSRPPVEVISVEDGEEVEQAAGSPSVQSRSPVTAPLGIFVWNESWRWRELVSRWTVLTLLNNGLDVYLKRLIGPCIGLARPGYQKEHLEPQIGRLIPSFNGMRYMQRPTRSKFASMLDFRTAMELDPKVLGEDWAIQRERICFHASEE